MTAIRQRWHRSAAVATGAAALVGTGMFVASPASAHVPGWKVDCYSTSIHLENYSEQGNTIKITAGDKTLVDEKFGRTFDKKVDLPKHTSPLEVRLVIDAVDDDKFDVNETKMSPVCEESPSPSEPAPSPSESSSEAPAPAPSEKPSTAPNGGGDDLAETGASSATPMIAGAAGVVLVAGAGLVVVARKRRSAQD
ncbi:LAETG motif-containing sortase-dependent surface protein [Streptomyces marispadix]|uniref:LPXTG cell wall anchor domain-containing protein n=1 Tax=Streptomyces marispadix TaxID=2922868 RepID=A0ABS9T520_9ACTN|nr:LAETG motif-containing sortase-dependent surface protein [Streptomyces marispadix]MCH6163655.1 LPXTG cell wall anchor domain-containing protein [Streptomyces marispadix]